MMKSVCINTLAAPNTTVTRHQWSLCKIITEGGVPTKGMVTLSHWFLACDVMCYAGNTMTHTQRLLYASWRSIIKLLAKLLQTTVA